ncbi:MAG: hypothetical protein V2G41_09645 [bacterium JZ-2024 1]
MPYTYAEAFQISNLETAREIEASRQVDILNLANGLIWRLFNWRWAIAALPPFWLIPHEQDYGAPQVAVPDDFWGLQKAVLVSVSGDSATHSPIRIVHELESTFLSGIPDAISYVRDKRAFRVFPRAGANVGCPTYLIEGSYKKLPQTITRSNYQTTSLPSPDHHIHMWIEAIKWAYYAIAKDQRAGAAQTYPNGMTAYSGQLGTAVAAAQECAKEDGLHQGDQLIYPSEPLAPIGSCFHPYFPF